MDRKISNMLLEGFEAMDYEEQQRFLKMAAAGAKGPEKENSTGQGKAKKIAPPTEAELDEVIKKMGI